tara:strand:- start:38653 stop:38865 length:213 start_codon:yes stop_codon:yes gene_type:complete
MIQIIRRNRLIKKMGKYANPKKGNIDIELGFIFGETYDKIRDNKEMIVIKMNKVLKAISFFNNFFIVHFV